MKISFHFELNDLENRPKFLNPTTNELQYRKLRENRSAGYFLSGNGITLDITDFLTPFRGEAEERGNKFSFMAPEKIRSKATRCGVFYEFFTAVYTVIFPSYGSLDMIV